MCPTCHEPLVAFELDGVEVDRCVACGGTWLDAGELELIAERAGAEPGGLSEALESANPKGRAERRCPRCRRKLQTILVDEQERIELERCSRGHGFWFDRGEMRTMITSFGEGEEGAVARFFSDFYRFEFEADMKGD
ncbi:MAG: zf-TFIIB domain-containing protein [bacterium]